MKKDRAALRQVLSAIAVVASLVFVGLEIRQNSAAQRIQTRQAIADATLEFSLRLAENPSLLRVWDEHFPLVSEVAESDSSTSSTLTRLDSLQAGGAMFALIRLLENVYLQHEEGVFDESILDNYGFTGGVFKSPAFAEWWFGPYLEVFDTAFVRAFEEANNLR